MKRFAPRKVATDLKILGAATHMKDSARLRI
jgi:hypothetical protein